MIQRLEFHYTPKHDSWLNMAEIEFSVFSNQCLNRRIEDEVSLKREIDALETERNQAGATIDWRFTTTDARNKLPHIYPSVSRRPGTSPHPTHPSLRRWRRAMQQRPAASSERNLTRMLTLLGQHSKVHPDSRAMSRSRPAACRASWLPNSSKNDSRVSF